MPFQAAKLKKVYASPKSKPCPHCMAEGGEVEDAMSEVDSAMEEHRRESPISGQIGKIAGAAMASMFQPKRRLTDQERAQAEEGPDTRPVNRGDSTTRYEQLPGGVTKIEIQGKAKGGIVKCPSCSKHYASGGQPRKMAEGGAVEDPGMASFSKYLAKIKPKDPDAMATTTEPDRTPADWKNSDPYDMGVTEPLPKRALAKGERLAWKRRPAPAPAEPVPAQERIAAGRGILNVRTGKQGPRTYAHGGIVSKGGDMGQNGSRRHDGVKGATGKDSPYEFDQNRITKAKFQTAFNNERKGNTEPIRAFAKGGAVPKTGISFAANLAASSRRKPLLGAYRKAKP